MRTTHKVLMLVENLSVPTDPRVWREARTLRHYGFEVSIICPKGETRDQESYTCIEDIYIYRYRLPTATGKPSDYLKEYGVAMLMTFWLSLKVWFRHGFDIIHAANPPDTFFFIGLFYRLFGGKKYVFDQHDLAPEMFHVKFQNRMKLLYKLLLFFERCSYRSAHLVLTTNKFQKKVAIERGGYTANKVFVVRSGPDITHFTPIRPEPELKQGKRFLLAYIGVMGVQDGVEYVLYALNELVHKRGRQDVSLVLMGEGDQLAVLRSLAHDLNLEGYVTFTGWVTGRGILRYLSVADVGLSPDPSNELNDNSTMHKTMEYMAMAKPVVAFDLHETRFSAQGAALYATPNCVEEFADHIETLLGNEELRLKMGAIGRKRIEEELSWDHTKKNLLQAYEVLFSRSSQPLAYSTSTITDIKRNQELINSTIPK
jgi:glycosyltransferase involved in cell wall biosynthesis